MPFDSFVRTKQINKPEFSGYIVDVLLQYLKSGAVTGIAMNTGQLTGQFYPLTYNPSGYLVFNNLSGYTTDQELISYNTNLLSYINQTYYPQTNPSGYVSSAQLTGMGGMSGEFLLLGVNGIVVTGIGTNIYISGSGFNALSNYVTWDYFDSGKGFNFDYLYLYDPVYNGTFIFNDSSQQYILQGNHNGYPSERYFIDLYGRSAQNYGLTYTRPVIYGFDVVGSDISSNGYPVLTSKDWTGIATNTQLLITSGDLQDDIDRVHSDVMDMFTVLELILRLV
jgi:hypothetical protein